MIIKINPYTEFYENPANGLVLIIDETWAARRAVDIRHFLLRKEK
jgi:hypothetical protein